MAVIRVPKTPKGAFNRHRKPSKLLKDQLTHFEWAVRPASERHPKDFRPKPPRTESQVASRIEKLTRRLLEPRETAAPPPAGPVAPAAARRPARSSGGGRAGGRKRR
jgi:hypothetical protein